MPRPDVLWQPAADARQRTRVGRYLAWLEAERGRSFADYGELWSWSVDDLDGFWRSVWQFFDVVAATPAQRARRCFHPEHGDVTLDLVLERHAEDAERVIARIRNRE